VPLTVSATDYDGNVALVEFFVGSAKLGQDATAPFTLTWTNSAEGPYTFSAVATDNNGFTATSAPVAITLQAGLISTGAVWKYLDSGINAGSAWRGTNFNDNAWASGPAQLGYGDDDEATEVGYGPNPTNKYITTYFRRRFAVTNASSFTNLLLRVLRDDGAVVYLNSNEVFRSNMPGGAIGYTTLASSSVPPADEATTFYSTNVSGTRVFNGTNVLAVEVHQASTNSSDLSFDLELIGQRPMIPPTLSIRTASPEAVLTWPEFPQGFQLESRPTLAPAATWSGVSNSITVSNGQNTLRMDVTGAASYFRLRKP